MNGSFCQRCRPKRAGVTLWSVKYKEEIAASYSTKERLLRLSRAVLQASVQGGTPSGRGRLWGTGHHYFTKPHLLVDSRRATRGLNVEVADGWATNKFRLDSTVKIPDVAVHGCQTIQTHLGDDLD